MTIVEAMREAIKIYIENNGTGNILTRNELYVLVNAVVSIEYNSFLPDDYCYNRTNKGISFARSIHLFEILDDERYKVLGENYMYDGPVFGEKKDSQEYEIKGIWSNGKYVEEVSDIYLRQIDIYDNLTNILKHAQVRIENTSLVVSSNDIDVCIIFVIDKSYKISTNITIWKEKISHFCTDEMGSIVYYVDTIDECISEIKRLLDFINTDIKSSFKSTLRKIVTADAFEKAYRAFIGQADKNAISKKAQGSKIPYGFSEKIECDGAIFKAQYGQGVPSAAPYMNWWVVSIYYLPSNGDIIIGIEEDRYPHLKEISIKPLRYERIGNKKVNVAVFYLTNINSVNYNALYEYFILLCEDVMRLGLY